MIIEFFNDLFQFFGSSLILFKLFQSGKLTGTQVAQLKAKYVELHMTLKK